MTSSQATGRDAPGASPGPARQVRRWSLAVVLAALPLAAQADNDAVRNPILVPGATWAFDGFRVNVPGEPGWYSLAKDAQYGDLARDLPDGVKLAAIVDARRLDAPVVGEQELLDFLRREQASVPDPATMKLVDYTAQPFAPKGMLCSRFAVKFDDRRTSFPAPGLLLVRGMACGRPDQPDVVVTLSYARRGPAADETPAAQKAADAFIDSLRFLPSNPAVISQAGLAVRSTTPQDAVELLTPAADDGDTEAALFLGNLYLYGRGIAHDFPAARKWLELAAEDGRAEAMYNLGAMYDKALGVPRDVAQALKWFTLAADQRDAPAQLNIALFYLNGDGVPKDVAAAEQWLRRAARNGSKRAQGILTQGKYKEPQ
jgi:hypothetical protein